MTESELLRYIARQLIKEKLEPIAFGMTKNDAETILERLLEIEEAENNHARQGNE